MQEEMSDLARISSDSEATVYITKCHAFIFGEMVTTASLGLQTSIQVHTIKLNLGFEQNSAFLLHCKASDIFSDFNFVFWENDFWVKISIL